MPGPEGHATYASFRGLKPPAPSDETVRNRNTSAYQTPDLFDARHTANVMLGRTSQSIRRTGGSLVANSLRKDSE